MSRPSLRNSINAFCRDCIHDQSEPGNWLQQVSACTAFDCALWPVRPVASAPWPAAITASLRATLGLTEAEAVRWRDNPHNAPNVAPDIRSGGARMPYRFDRIITGRKA